jgi:oxysterol-binding protein-related protein 9/10/11
VHLEGYNAQKATFTRTINIKQIGHAVLTVPAADGKSEPDKYLITLPALHIEGLYLGAPFIELEGATYITSSTGFTAKIDYSGKGWISGKKNSFTASLYPQGKEKEVLYNVAGQWTKTFEVHSGPPKANSSANLLETWEPSQHPTSKLIIAPKESQHPFEARRAWAGVAAGIAKGDMDAVAQEKGKIEHAQRELRLKEKGEGKMWQRRYFTVQMADPVLSQYASRVGLSDHGDSDKTGGLWRFDRTKADKVKAEKPLTEEEAKKIAKEVLGQ